MQGVWSKRGIRQILKQQNDENEQISLDDTPYINKLTVDYKEKVFELMKRNTQLEMHLRKYEDKIFLLQKQSQTLKTQVNLFFDHFGFKSFEQVEKKFLLLLGEKERELEESQLINSERNYVSLLSLQEKQTQFDKIIKQYQNIIKTQHKKLQNKTKKYKEIENKLKKQLQELKNGQFNKDQIEMLKKENFTLKERKTQIQDLNEQLTKTVSELRQEKLAFDEKLVKSQEQLKEKQEKITKLDEQLEYIMNESQALFEEKNQIEQRHKKDIMHFQQMENLVEKKLIQVEYEMNFYKNERKDHLEQISLLKKELEIRQQKNYYSFGDNQRHQEVQTQFFDESKSEDKNWENSCFEESIKTLLEQNNRLKHALIYVYKHEKNEKLPENIELQLKILLSTSSQCHEDCQTSSTQQNYER